MKRGKDGEKVAGPMFPRLHVNDTEKGGPRAPPRNKMALYEQLSIPSQRFIPNLNTSSATSSTQGNDNKTPLFFPIHLPRSTPIVNTSLAAPQKRLDEEDYTVPIFVDRENMSLSRPSHILPSSRNQSSDKEQKQNSTIVSNLRQKGRWLRKELQCPFGYQDDVDQLQRTTYDLYHQVIDESQLQILHNATPNGEYHKDKTVNSLGIQNEDRCGDESDTSMLDSVSVVSITPDDIVGVIGQKHFWKARRAIVDQQRVFAVQVFELHRLIKVQKLFAGSPNLALEDTTFLEKTSKTSIPKEISLEFIVKLPANIENHENGVEKSSISSSHQPPVFLPNPQLTPVITEPSASPWCFSQPAGHHWLVPVMSPTEGLIFKPYSGSENTGSFPMITNFSNIPYGMIPNYNHFLHGMGVPPGFPLMSHHHGYFPPYGMMPPVETSFGEQQQDSCSGSKPGFVKTHE